MAAIKLLVLTAFTAQAASDDPNSTDVTLTVKGPATKIPENVTHVEGEKGTRKITINAAQTGLLEATGKVLQVPEAGKVKVAEGCEDWFAWLKTYVPAENGGTLQAGPPPNAEPEAAGPPADAKSKKGKGKGKDKPAETTPAPADEVAGDPKEVRRAALREMPLLKVKEAYKGLYGKGARPGMKTDQIIDDVIAAEFNPEHKAAEPAAPKAPKAKKDKPAETTPPENVAPGGAKKAKDTFPGFEEGKEVKVDYNHRDIGKVTYGAIFHPDGTGFEITTLEGNRDDMKVGDKFRTAGDLCKKLMRKDKHHMSVARFFGLTEGTRA